MSGVIHHARVPRLGAKLRFDAALPKVRRQLLFTGWKVIARENEGALGETAALGEQVHGRQLAQGCRFDGVAGGLRALFGRRFLRELPAALLQHLQSAKLPDVGSTRNNRSPEDEATDVSALAGGKRCQRRA